jgi:hypothetical protein
MDGTYRIHRRDKKILSEHLKKWIKLGDKGVYENVVLTRTLQTKGGGSFKMASYNVQLPTQTAGICLQTELLSASQGKLSSVVLAGVNYMT